VSGDADLTNLNVSGTTNINNLSVVSATISGNLTVQGLTSVTNLQISGHLITSGTTPVAAAAVNAGTSASCSVTGNDTGGQITITTGSGSWSAGTQCSLTFASAYASQPHPVISPATAAGATTNVSAVNPYVDSTTTNLDIDFNSPDTGSHTYVFNYFNAQ
jgi:hypothetical protein